MSTNNFGQGSGSAWGQFHLRGLNGYPSVCWRICGLPLGSVMSRLPISPSCPVRQKSSWVSTSQSRPCRTHIAQFGKELSRGSQRGNTLGGSQPETDGCAVSPGGCRPQAGEISDDQLADAGGM